GLVLRVHVVPVERVVPEAGRGELALQHVGHALFHQVLPAHRVAPRLEGGRLRVHLLELGRVGPQHVRPEPAQPGGEVGLRLARGADGPELTPLTGPVLPMPAPVPALPAGPVGFYRPNRMDVWQTLAVDRYGHWRPRVALTATGAYYPNGMPYPWLGVRPLDVL